MKKLILIAITIIISGIVFGSIKHADAMGNKLWSCTYTHPAHDGAEQFSTNIGFIGPTCPPPSYQPVQKVIDDKLGDGHEFVNYLIVTDASNSNYQVYSGETRDMKECTITTEGHSTGFH